MGSHAMAGTQSPAELDDGDLRRMENTVRDSPMVWRLARWIGSSGHCHPSQLSVFNSMQEPDALNAQVRICAGGAG